MLNNLQIKRTFQKFPLVVVILLLVVLLSGYAGIQNHLANGRSSMVDSKCSTNENSPKVLIEVNEMLLSIKSLSLSDDN